MTGQVRIDGYDGDDGAAGALVAIDLVNALVVDHAYGRPAQPSDPRAAIGDTLESDPTWPALRARDVPGFIELAKRLRAVFERVRDRDLDAAAVELNRLLAASPALPHLSKDGGRWRLHHHPADAALVPMATASCAEAMARLLGTGQAGRLGTCEADACDRVFLDESKNASRRFCSTTCQNRVKAAAFRRRRATSEGRGTT